MSKNKRSNRPTLARKEMEKTIDIATGLNHAQLRAAKLMAGGTSGKKVAELLGVHVNTIYHWKKSNTMFQKVLENEKILQNKQKPIAVAPLDEFSLSAVDTRFAQLLVPAIESLNEVLANPQASEMARVNAAKYVCTRIYDRLVSNEKLQSQNVDALRDALKLIK